ncbi:helix-turn-helix domain-containing protein [Staphylococcus capitis]|uniref:helix-turn-helix domain-containing protein n=1 Tax=Staphylococcus capitis TaxID=29388 RepID=UPI00066E25F8|nr:helix-turn-helix transcriptional regulator [Staphylococcus capitis]MBC8780326.1 helix-turn-helix transcriptional regulator [Staphylococcus capitis]MBE7322192.1 helix-turn-helix transcriptional regulator [Staphylococcus capitis]MBU5291886.1 helix-turn-helix domain-containing protein [Staphylococcus capitis]MCC3691189.1 helix-turn-helix domain-containing protein [Staphylococcus capitis]MCC3695861.1 helix-turn-helix domain-containing protein [Staphylococcus capitis]
MNLHILYNLRTKRHLEIEELAQQLNEKYGTHYEAHQIWEWENHYHEPKFKDALHLADFFNTPYQMFLESKVKEYQKHLDDVDIRM